MKVTMKKDSTNHKLKPGKKNYLIVSNDGYTRGLMTFAYFKKRLSELGFSNRVHVQTAGLVVSKGLTPDPLAVKILKKKEIPLNGFQVEPVSEDLLKKADVVIALSRENHNYLRNTYHATPPKVRILNVPVLIAKKEENYENAFQKIEESLDQELQSLKA